MTSLPYHHPLMVAKRFVQLDHMTRGRTMLGCGPGALPSDAYMMGIEPSTQRGAHGGVAGRDHGLLRCEEPVTMKTDWFELNDARLHLAPYTDPHFPSLCQHDHAVWHDRGGQARGRRAVDRRRPAGRARGDGQAVGDLRGDRGQARHRR